MNLAVKYRELVSRVLSSLEVPEQLPVEEKCRLFYRVFSIFTELAVTYVTSEEATQRDVDEVLSELKRLVDTLILKLRISEKCIEVTRKTLKTMYETYLRRAYEREAKARVNT